MNYSIISSKNNTTTDALNSGEEFVGEYDFNRHKSIMVTVATDKNGVLSIDFSNDGVSVSSTLTYNYNTQRINPPHILTKGYRYSRVRFLNNDSANQTFINITTSYGGYGNLTAPINATLAENYDAQVTRPTNFIYEVATNKRQGNFIWNKFGENASIGNTEELVANFGGNFSPIITAETLSIESSSNSDTLGGIGANSVIIIGVNSDGDVQEEVVELSGTTPVTTLNQFLGVNRVRVESVGSNNNAVGTISINGTNSDIEQALIEPNTNITKQCIFNVPTNHNFLMDWIYVNIIKLSGGGSSRVTIKAYIYSREKAINYEIFKTLIDTSVTNHVELRPKHPFSVEEDSILYFTASSSTASTDVNIRFSGLLNRLS